MILLVKLILAHMLGDFLFQPNTWVVAKEEKKLYSWQLYVHALIHFVLIMLLTADITFWKWAILLAALHLVSDTARLYIQTVKTKQTFFFIDQFFHFLYIFLIWLWYQGKWILPPVQNKEFYIILFTVIYTLTKPVSLFISAFISRWLPEKEGNNFDYLHKAGNYIGIFERLFVFAFVFYDKWDAVGFLIAAKSIFRFGGLQETDDKKRPEYIMIGTLLSFGIAMLAGILLSQMK